MPPATVSLEALGDGNWWLKDSRAAELDRYLVDKGSITIDGISLTIARCDRARDLIVWRHDYSAHVREHDARPARVGRATEHRSGRARQARREIAARREAGRSATEPGVTTIPSLIGVSDGSATSSLSFKPSTWVRVVFAIAQRDLLPLE